MVGGAPSGSRCTRYGRPDRSTAACTRHSSIGMVASPNRRVPALSPGRLRERLAERDGGVLDGVVRVDVQVALDLDGQVEQAVLAERREHVVVEADAGRDVGVPVPVQVDGQHDLGLFRRALDASHSIHAVHLFQRGAECGHLLRRAHRHAQPAVRSSLPDEHATVEQPLPYGVPIGKPAEQHEVRVGVRHLVPAVAQPVDERVALVAQRAHRGQQLAAVRERDAGDRLRDGGQVVRQPDDAHRVDDGGRRGEVAQSPAGERERLRHRPRHDQARVVGQQRQRARRARAAELGVRLVDDDHARRGGERAPRRRATTAPSRSGCSARRAARRTDGARRSCRARRAGRSRSPPRAGRRPSAVCESRAYSGYIE